jgi:chemotaxis protein MotB
MGKEQVDTDHGKQTTNIIIVKKGRGGHGGGHGGAWKVAYADFVTAMMAFFLVMWLLASGDNVKEAVQAYFQDPIGFNEKVQAGLLVGSGIAVIPGPGQSAPPIEITQETLLEVQERLMAQAAEELRESLQAIIPNFEDLEQAITIEITPEGLMIELIDGEKGNFFEIGSSVLAPRTKKILQAIAEQFGNFNNRVRIIGHTDARPYSIRGGYSNWELSTDRANSARRVMETAGLYQGQILNVAGYADQDLKNKANPYDVTNRRISILLMNKEQLFGMDTIFLKPKNY